MRHKIMRKKVLAAIVVGLICLITLSEVYSFQVAPLPSGNLVTNPWFRSDDDPNESGLDSWTDADGKDKYWSSSQKEGNPSPEILVSGVCGFQQVYCGTAARLSTTQGESGGIGQPGVDSYLYQIIPADSSHRKLKFFTHWVSHRIDPAEVTIYGSNSANGPWTNLWTPLYHEQDVNPPPPPGGSADLWTDTGMLSRTLNNGYDFYKLEIHAQLPQGEGVGFKITGIYFSTEPAGTSPTATPPATPTSELPTRETPTSEPPVTETPTKEAPTPTPTRDRPKRTVYIPRILAGD